MMYTLSLGGLTFPLAPSGLQQKRKSRNRTVDLLDGTQTVIKRTPALREYTAELLLPASVYPFAVYPNGFQPPAYYMERLEQMQSAEESVVLVITRAAQREEVTVCIEDVSYGEDAKNGRDVLLTLTLREVESDIRPSSASLRTEYTVRAGDTLRMIARRVMGDAELWTYLYGYNVDVIEDAAQAAGYADSRFGERLMPGITLIIPQEVV